MADRVIADHSAGTVSNIVSSGLGGSKVADAQSANPLQQQAEEDNQEQSEQEEAQASLIQLQSDDAEDEEEQNAQARLLQCQPEEGQDEAVQAKAEAGKKPEQEGKQLKYVVNVDAPEQEPKEEVQARAEINRREDEERLQGKQASPSAGRGTSVAAMLNSSKGGGSPLSANVRGEMESQFSADFSGVRIHTGSTAVAMSGQIHAQAFTHGSDIYFNEGKYDPGSSAGRHLLAHELTHTIQQGASRQRGESPAPVQRKVDERIQRSWLGNTWDAVSDVASSAVNFVGEQLDAALNYAKGLFTDFVQGIPGYKLLSVVLGQDPVTGRAVEQNGINFIEAGLDVIPFGDSFRRKLDETGKLQEAAAWLDERMKSLDGISLSAILANLAGFWSSLSITDLGNIPGVLERATNIIRDPIARIVTFCGDVASYFLKLIKDYLLGELSGFVASQEQARGFPLLTVILGKNPITDEEVPRNGMNLIRGFMLLSADGEEQLRQMEESGSLQRAAEWIDTSVANLGLAWEGIKNAFTESWALVTIENLVTNPVGTFLEIVGKFVAPVTIILNFLLEVGRMILQFIKEALLSRLSAHARETRGYMLLTVILGRDPFTGVAVERNAENLIHGFMALMEGGEQQFQEMKQSGAIDRMTDRIERAVATLNFTWDYITGLFLAAWNSFSLQDLAAPLDAFVRIVNLFADPLLRLFAFVVEVVKIAIEVALQLMQFPFALINNIIAKAMQAFNDIKRDPIGFLKNLLRAVKTGFVQFFDRIGTHLLNGVTGWLFKELGDAGISPPTDLSLRSILGLVFDVLGISMDKIFEKLAAKIGQERVAQIRAMGERLAGAWAFISDVMTRGPIAIWEYVQEKLNNLWSMVLEAISNWIVTRIISQVTAKLLSMLDPTGIMAVVNGFIAFFKAVQSFIAYLREMLEIVNSFVEGVAEIAAGNVTSAANYLEGALARAMPVAIGFLANQVGLGGLGRRIGEMIGRAQEKVDEGIDWLIDKAMKAGTSFMNMLRGGGNAQEGANGAASDASLDGKSIDAVLAMPPSTEPRDAAQKQKDVDDAAALVRRIANGEDSAVDLGERFAAIKKRFALKEIGFKDVGKPAAGIEIAINPSARIEGDKLGKAGRLEWEGELQKASLTNDVVFSGARNLRGAGMAATKMEAKRLGPNHPMGSETSSGNSIADVMGELKSASGATTDGFVAGHLLNYQLGGPGDDARNLFPITGYANNRHSNDVEKIVKGWVNDDHYWVTYTVKVEVGDYNFNLGADRNYVEADFVCEAHPLKLDGETKADGGFKKTIHSTYNAKAENREGYKAEAVDENRVGAAGRGNAVSDPRFKGVAETVPRK